MQTFTFLCVKEYSVCMYMHLVGDTFKKHHLMYTAMYSHWLPLAEWLSSKEQLLPEVQHMGKIQFLLIWCCR